MERILLMTVALSAVTSALSLDNLYEDVFENKTFVVPPCCGDKGPVEVTLGVALRQIIELDEPRQLLTSIVWIRLEWRDCRLIWNSTLYDGIEEVIIPQDVIWVPDLTLYDNAAVGLKGLEEFHVRVTHSGIVRYQFPSIIKSLCAINVKQFPFDYQECKLTFGSWAYSGLYINLRNQSNSADIQSFVSNVEWHVIGVPATRTETWYNGDPYPTVVFVIQLQRRPLFYTINLIFPCALITTVAMFGFLLPSASREKIHLEIHVLLSMAVFQLIILELMPPTGDAVSFIGLFFIMSLLLVGSSCCLTVFVLKIHFGGCDDKPLPLWLKRFCVVPLARLLCYDTTRLRRKRSYNIMGMHRCSKNNSTGTSSFREKADEESAVCTVSVLPKRNSDDCEIKDDATVETIAGRSCEGRSLMNHIEYIAGQLNSITEHLSRNTQTVPVMSEWRLFATLLDRLFLILYIISLLACTLSLYIRHSLDTTERR